ncbi:PAS domain S-box protein, partial [Patescibacteria group bacterium]|nr:PAS domain S-box protein [Patescibacteria group bacterium]
MAKNNNLNLDFILQSIKDYAIFMLDKNGKIKTWNRAAEKIYLYKKRDVIGKSPSIFFTQSDVENNHPETSLKIAVEKGRHEDEGPRIKKDKSLFWASVIVTPVYNKQKELEGFVKVVRDITERKRKEDEKDEFL